MLLFLHICFSNDSFCPGYDMGETTPCNRSCYTTCCNVLCVRRILCRSKVKLHCIHFLIFHKVSQFCMFVFQPVLTLNIKYWSNINNAEIHGWTSKLVDQNIQSREYRSTIRNNGCFKRQICSEVLLDTKENFNTLSRQRNYFY